MTSQIRVDEITNRSGLGTVTIYDNGFEFTGVTTFTEDVDITGGLTIGGVLTYEDVTNIDSVGIITARAGINISGGNLQVGGTNVINSGRVLYNLEQIKLADAKELVLGSGNDFKIQHSGSHSFISQEGVGALKIKGDDIRFEDAGGTEALRITSDGKVNINASTESVGGRVVIKNNVDYTTTDFDDNPTLYLLNDDRTTGVSEAAIVFAGRNSSGSTYRSAISGNGSTGFKFYSNNNAESDDTPALRITSAGDVGINQTSPSTALSVYDGQSSVNTVIRVGTNAVSSTNNGYAQIEFKHGSASSAWIWHNANSTTGFGGANSLNFYNGNAADYAFFSGGNNERFRIKSDGNVQITDGNLVLASGHGIDFSAAGNASGMSSELLDDYEEGTFTPNDASGAGLTFVEAAGIYTKVGRMVHVQVRVKYPSTSNNSYVSIGGLPFSATNQGTNISNGANASGFGYFTGSNLPQIHMSASGTHTNFYYLSTIQRNNNLSGLELRFGVVYSTS